MTTCEYSGGRYLIERLLVEHAGLAVNGDEERLEAHRLDVLAEVLRDEAGDLLDASRRLHHFLEHDRLGQEWR